MSGYQYYEFQTIDRRLDEREMQDLRGYSSRARITPTSFTNEYSFGSFTFIPGSPDRKRDLSMARRTKSGKQAADMLERLDSEEAVAVLHLLLDKHPELRPEVEGMAKNVMSSNSIEDIAADVFSAVAGVDLEALNGRAGKHSWGYVEPSEAAWELLEEALEDWIDDMKRKAEADLLTAAQAVCVGIVAGLYKARNATSDGVLNWAPDFPAEHAGYVVQQFLQLCRYKMNASAREHLLKTLTIHAPGWEDMFESPCQGVCHPMADSSVPWRWLLRRV